MPKFSKTNPARHEDFGAGEEWVTDLGDQTTSIVRLRHDVDLTPLLVGLPDDLCQCPHWGYMFSGSQTARYADGHEETFEAGDVFYMSPGHTARATAGSEFVVMSPAALQAESEKVIAANAQRLAAAN